MLENTIVQWTIGILATILLGAIGSGFWDIILKPSLRYISFKAMSLTAFIFNKWKNSIYRKIGLYRNVLSTAQSIILFYPILSLFMIFLIQNQNMINSRKSMYEVYNKVILEITPEDIYKIYTQSGGDEYFFLEKFIVYEIMRYDFYMDKLLHNISSIKIDIEKYKKAKNKDKDLLRDSIVKKLKKADEINDKVVLSFYIYNYIDLIVLPFFLISFLFFILLSPFFYIEDTRELFTQCLDICTPYMPPRRRDLVFSKFRQVASREDFIAVMNELQQIAEKEKLVLPKYKIW